MESPARGDFRNDGMIVVDHEEKERKIKTNECSVLVRCAEAE